MPKILRNVGIAALMIAVAVACTVWMAFGRLERAEEAMFDRWRELLGGQSFLERFPAVEANATTLEIERLAAVLGIDATPHGAPRKEPDEEIAAAFGETYELLKDYLDAVRKTDLDEWPEPLPEFGDFSRRHAETIEELVTLLLSAPPPVWRGDLAAGFEAELPNLLGILKLQVVLLSQAHQFAADGETRSALRVLEASWQLDAAVRKQPYLISELISHAVMRYQQPVLRRLCRIPQQDANRWIERLENLDSRRETRIALAGEAFAAHRSAQMGGSDLWDEDTPRWIAWFGKHGLRDYSVRMHAYGEELSQRDLLTFDSQAYLDEHEARIPRWAIVARILLPNFSDAWVRAARLEVSAELTARVLEERLHRAGGVNLARDDRDTAIDGLRFVYEESEGNVTITVDGDVLEPGDKAVPLRFTVSADCR